MHQAVIIVFINWRRKNFSRDTITLPNLIMAQCNVKANFGESRDTITLPNLIMA